MRTGTAKLRLPVCKHSRRHVLLCQHRATASTGKQQHPGSVRRVAVNRKPVDKKIPMEALNRFCERGALAKAAMKCLQHPAVGQGDPPQLMRFPSSEFRTLALNSLAKSSQLTPFPDKGMWNNYKVQLAELLLQRAEGRNDYPQQLQHIAEVVMERERSSLGRLMANDSIPDQQKDLIKARHGTKAARVHAQLESWCEATAANPYFSYIKPVLQQVLSSVPAPLIERRNDGQRTEDAVSALVERELPAGWSMYTQARMASIDGQAYKSERQCKGEADVLLVDPQGIVQAIVEIKTAKGNPYLALYEDVVRFHNLVGKVRGKLVTFVPGPHHSSSATNTTTATITNGSSSSGKASPAAGGSGASTPSRPLSPGFSALHISNGQSSSQTLVLKSTSSSSSSSQGGAASSPTFAQSGSASGAAQAALPASSPSGTHAATAVATAAVPIVTAAPVAAPQATSSSSSNPGPVTLRFSKSAKPIYVLGSAITPEALEDVVRAAHSKLLTMEFGRMLSSSIEAWKDISIVDLAPEYTVLQVPGTSIPECEANVRRYFEMLQGFDIFMVPNLPE